MKEFGWSIEYVLSLTFPVFFDLFCLIKRIRLDAAIDEFYIPYGAAKFGGKCSNHLFEGRGSIILKDSTNSPKEKITPAMVRKATQRLQRIIKAREEELRQKTENV